MRGERTYGKRSRAVFDARVVCLPSSSPDQPTTQPLKAEKIKPVAPGGSRRRRRRRRSELQSHSTEGLRTSPTCRRALGEKHVNAAVLPVEALETVQQTRTTKARVRQNAKATKNAVPEQRVDASGNAARCGQHTFFEHEADQRGEAPATDALPVITQQPRRSPRKIKQKATLTLPLSPAPTVADDTGALDRVSSDQVIEREVPQAEGTREQESPYQEHCAELLNLSTHPLINFATWSAEISDHFTATKIAEASFGEVYRLSLKEDISDFCRTDESVFKVIPLTAALTALPLDKRKRAAALKRSEGMTSPHDVATEVKLLQRMSSIPGFTNFRDIRILQGRPPPAFIEAFKAWNKSQKANKKELSHFPDPAKKSSYNDDQLWAVIEMQDAGSDLERLVEAGTCTSVFDIWDIFWQAVLSIAKGEEAAEFEHRDLHLGNICVRAHSTTTSTPDDAETTINTTKKLGFTNVETTIIDYTLSRCVMPNNTSVAYTDLASPAQAALFEGDSTEEYQYDIYRYMRGALYLDDPLAAVHEMTHEALAATGRSWEQFHPQTNLVWIHLVLYKLLEQIDWPSAKKAPQKRRQAVEFALWKREIDLEHVLLKVQDLLDPTAVCANGIRSAADLVAFAVGEAWLDVEDVVGRDSMDESALISQLEGLEIRV